MKDPKSKKRLIAVIVTILIALAIVITDGILFYTSLQETGVGRGFSRYWDSRD
jgi:hypothetical protein